MRNSLNDEMNCKRVGREVYLYLYFEALPFGLRLGRIHPTARWLVRGVLPKPYLRHNYMTMLHLTNNYLGKKSHRLTC
jgi:hypothetical protein